MLRILIVITLLVISNQSLAKSKCEKEWDALKAVQAQLRHKSTEYLRNKERIRHTEYQNCRKGKSKKSSNGNSVKTTYKPQKKYYSNKKVRNSFGNSKVNIKSKFTGEKQEAWLAFYKTPKECIAPKTTTKFAKCINDRNLAAKHFTNNWDNR